MTCLRGHLARAHPPGGTSSVWGERYSEPDAGAGLASLRPGVGGPERHALREVGERARDRCRHRPGAPGSARELGADHVVHAVEADPVAAIHGSWTFSKAELIEIARFMVDVLVPLEKLITHRSALDDAMEAFRLFDGATTGKCVLVMDERRGPRRARALPARPALRVIAAAESHRLGPRSCTGAAPRRTAGCLALGRRVPQVIRVTGSASRAR